MGRNELYMTNHLKNAVISENAILVANEGGLPEVTFGDVLGLGWIWNLHSANPGRVLYPRGTHEEAALIVSPTDQHAWLDAEVGCGFAAGVDLGWKGYSQRHECA